MMAVADDCDRWLCSNATRMAAYHSLQLTAEAVAVKLVRKNRSINIQTAMCVGISGIQ